MAKEVTVTEEGLKKLQAELDYLKTIKRNEVKEAIKVARSFGDLSENSEYDEAKDEQAKTESRISELEEMLLNVILITDKEIKTDRVSVGTSVRVRNLNKNKEVTYFLVGSTEADALKGKISDESPTGKALLGARVGDKVSFQTPKGDITLEILEISK